MGRLVGDLPARAPEESHGPRGGSARCPTSTGGVHISTYAKSPAVVLTGVGGTSPSCGHASPRHRSAGRWDGRRRSRYAPRRFAVRTEAGLRRRPHRAVLDGLGARREVDWTSAIVDASSVRAEKGHTDRAESGWSRQAGQQAACPVRRPGHPAGCCVSAANRHDSQALKPLVLAIPDVRSRRGPRRRRPVKVRADRAYYSADHLTWLRARGLIPRPRVRGRARRAARPPPLEDRAVDLLAVRPPPARSSPNSPHGTSSNC